LLSRPQANQYPGFTRLTAAKQIADVDFERLDAAAFKLENSLKRLIESLQKKDLTGNLGRQLRHRESKRNIDRRKNRETGRHARSSTLQSSLHSSTLSSSSKSD